MWFTFNGLKCANSPVRAVNFNHSFFSFLFEMPCVNRPFDSEFIVESDFLIFYNQILVWPHSTGLFRLYKALLCREEGRGGRAEWNGDFSPRTGWWVWSPHRLPASVRSLFIPALALPRCYLSIPSVPGTFLRRRNGPASVSLNHNIWNYVIMNSRAHSSVP